MHTYDHSELEGDLQAHVAGFGALDAVEKFSDGQSNPTYKLRSGTRQYVMGTRPTVKLLKSAHAVNRAETGMPAEDEYVDLYCQRRGVARPGNWTFYLVLSYFRLLAILQGVLKRGLDGNASNPRDADMMRQVIALMAAEARKLADG